MNQNRLLQLTTLLSQALDKNYDVVHMETVISVICMLEGTPITKEQLEATRLAKYINHLRRRTTNENLARRAKSLLKKWREMVGINQHSTDSHNQQIQTYKYNTEAIISEEASVKSLQNSFTVQTSHEKNADSDGNLNVLKQKDSLTSWNITKCSDLSTQPIHDQKHTWDSACTTSDNQQHPMIISKLIDSTSGININEKESDSKKPRNENSVTSASNGKFEDNSIIINIASDSDECDTEKIENNKIKEFYSLALSNLHKKKMKKDKKRKGKNAPDMSLLLNQHELSRQSICTSGEQTANKEQQCKISNPIVSEILSLSNSSVSSLLSGEVTVAKTQSTSESLSFAGKFKSLAQISYSNYGTDDLSNGNVKSLIINQRDQEIYSEFGTNETSTSESRLSAYEEFDNKQREFRLFNPRFESNQIFLNNLPYKNECSENIVDKIPKKRGRKKGSKGVDSLIAKESSLSQQIFLSSSAKKVKTTKELFNEIQNRNLSLSSKRTESSLASAKNTNASSRLQQKSRFSLTGPESICSDISIHSPSTEDTYAVCGTHIDSETTWPGNKDLENSESDSSTSEPSHDSLKSSEIKRSTSLDSSCNSTPVLVDKNIRNKSSNSEDVYTQLMHIVHSIHGPKSIVEAEEIYQAQIVPCTCLVLEELPKLSAGQKNLSKLNTEASEYSINNSERVVNNAKEITQREVFTLDDVTLSNQQKPPKSIFDLDFDDEEDPLHLLMNELTPSVTSSKPSKESNTLISKNNNLQDDKFVDAQIFGDSANELINEANQNFLPLFTIQEDPNCVAKQRFHIQTNKVTNFHVDALHNCYIPSINGNWNSETRPSFLNSLLSENSDSVDLYTVTDGANVVPKYGSLTNERIKKNLSYLRFTSNLRKSKKEQIAPFLGVAKCLESCRRIKHAKADHLRENVNFVELIKKCCNPIRLQDRLDGISINNKLDDFSPMIGKSGTTIHNNVLRCENLENINKRQHGHSKSKQTHQSICDKSNNRTQKSIQKHEYIQRKFKKRKRIESRADCDLNEWNLSDTPKRAKITAKEQMKSQIRTSTVSSENNEHRSRLSSSSIESLVDNERQRFPVDYIENSNIEEYAIVQRPTDEGSDHIVLTIKKTPGKVISTDNILAPNFPNEASNDKLVQNHTESNPLNQYNKCRSDMRAVEVNTLKLNKDDLVSQSCSKNSDHQKTFSQDHSRIKKKICGKSFKKSHRELFFADELCIHDKGQKTRVINYSSSSSSNYGDDDDFGDYLSSDETEIINNINVKIETDINSNASWDVDESYELTETTPLSFEDDTENPKELDNLTDVQLHNNSMLPTFNSIFAEESVIYSSRDVLSKYTDDFNNCLTSKNSVSKNVDSNLSTPELNIVKTSTNKYLTVSEYCTGMRVVKNVPGKMDLTSSRTQEFKEWHQVLQLKSYNNEPLVILPYVVLE